MPLLTAGAMAALPYAATGLAAGGGILAGLFGGGKKKKEPDWAMPPAEFKEEPMFPEATGARQTWSQRLQEWGGEPGYGAIAPDWGDIWERAQKRVGQYYWGGPGGQPGLAGKVRASAARRGVAQGPALETELGRMGMQESQQLQEMSTEQALQEAQFGETGRQNWLTSLMGLARERVPGRWNVGQQDVRPEQPGMGQLLGQLGGAGMEYMGQQNLMKYYEDLLEKMMPKKTTSPYGLTMPTGAEAFGTAGAYGY